MSQKWGMDQYIKGFGYDSPSEEQREGNKLNLTCQKKGLCIQRCVVSHNYWKQRGHKFKRKQGRVHWMLWREERKGRKKLKKLIEDEKASHVQELVELMSCEWPCYWKTHRFNIVPVKIPVVSFLNQKNNLKNSYGNKKTTRS